MARKKCSAEFKANVAIELIKGELLTNKQKAWARQFLRIETIFLL